MECERIKELLIPFLDGNIQDSLKDEVKGHLEKCKNCREEAILLKKSWQMLDDYEVPKLRDDFTFSVMERILTAQSESEQEHSNESCSISLWNYWRRPLSWSAAAAVLLLAAILSFILLNEKISDKGQIAQDDDTTEQIIEQEQIVQAEDDISVDKVEKTIEKEHIVNAERVVPEETIEKFIDEEQAVQHDEIVPNEIKEERDDGPLEAVAILTDEDIIQNLDILVNMDLLENMELLEVMEELREEETEIKTSKIVAYNYEFKY